jgi:hypothetical protein
MTRKFLDFLASPTGKFSGFMIVVVIGCLAYNFYRSQPKAVKKKEVTTFNDAIEIERDFSRHRDGFEPNVQAGRVTTPKEREIKEKQKELEKKEQDIADLEKALAEEKTRRATDDIKKQLGNLNVNPVPPGTLPKDGKDGIDGIGRDGKDGSAGAIIIANNLPDSPTAVKEKTPKFSVSPLSLVQVREEKKPVQAGLSDTILPYGRLIKCQLVNTVDSASMETPVIAIVTDDVWHNGKKVIPAGTEVHGEAQSATIRNRIATNKDWVFVWRTKPGSPDNGKELLVKGLALDYAQNIHTKRYDITDGSAGLKGFEIKTDEYAELKLYAALFLKGVGEGVTDLLLEEAKSQDSNTFVGDGNTGEQSDEDEDEKNQIKVGMAKGAQEVADQYAQTMLDAIARDGVFIRVPAGTTFYLYAQQTIDKQQAVLGASIGVKTEPNVDAEERQRQETEELNQLMLSLIKQRAEKEAQKTANQNQSEKEK